MVWRACRGAEPGICGGACQVERSVHRRCTIDAAPEGSREACGDIVADEVRRGDNHRDAVSVQRQSVGPCCTPVQEHQLEVGQLLEEPDERRRHDGGGAAITAFEEQGVLRRVPPEVQRNGPILIRDTALDQIVERRVRVLDQFHGSLRYGAAQRGSILPELLCQIAEVALAIPAVVGVREYNHGDHSAAATRYGFAPIYSEQLGHAAFCCTVSAKAHRPVTN
jgi:hypothetical protein